MSKTEEEFKKLLFDEIHIQPNTYDIDTKQLCDDVVQELKAQGFFIGKFRPIEEAPKNAPVLVKFKNRAGMDRIVKAFYAKKFTLPYEGDCEEWADYDESSGECYAPEGWYEDVYGDHECESLNSEKITHFMPLPPSPEGEE